ncbi:MoaD/ThiS family protein [Dongia soli]|uniref:MoaD/ThiS family protein n=1 Tax=Dongia soli TaxID=600628 RepID=A0ABU5E928_9PROT|nr:MoaD/ThiS family protein [Dongia soli]MDY0882865.1 MoaD/ThiS family protein [Dongia soli]
MPEQTLPIIDVTLPVVLRRLFPDAPRQVRLKAATVKDAIDALDDRWPGMRDRLCDSRPSIRRHINIFVAGERATLQTSLADGSDVVILTAISGG